MHSPTMRLVITVLVVLGAAGTWSDKGREQLTLPTVDLPAARSGVVLRHSPRFEITPVTGGTFRVVTDGGPFTATLRDSVPIPADRSRDEVAQRIAPSPPPVPPRGGRLLSGPVPVAVPMPEFGRAVFLASELTAELQSPSVEFTYERENRVSGYLAASGSRGSYTRVVSRPAPPRPPSIRAATVRRRGSADML